MSRRLTLNPVAIFICVALWWWLWGSPAHPRGSLLATFKILCDHVESVREHRRFLQSGLEPLRQPRRIGLLREHPDAPLGLEPLVNAANRWRSTVKPS